MTANGPQSPARGTDVLRAGDVPLANDPARAAPDAHLVYIGRICSAWVEGTTTPKNPTEARARSTAARIEILPPFRPGLLGLAAYSHVFVLAWLDGARRDIIVHQPRHLSAPRGVLATRAPVRPNPIGLSVARILAVDVAAGVVILDAIDFRDGTPVLDLKPYRPGIDAIPDALIG